MSSAAQALASDCPPAQDVPAIESRATSLMRAAKHGDARAFDQLVRSLRGLAFQIAHGLVSSREDALDLSQEAFLKVYRARASYRESDPFLPWFHRILRNTCISFLRKHKRVRSHSLDAAWNGADEDPIAWQIAEDLPPIESALATEELGLAVRHALAQLSIIDREILVLRHFEDLSYKEIAHLLELKEGTVMSRLFHARRRLRDQLVDRLDAHLPDLAPPRE